MIMMVAVVVMVCGCQGGGLPLPGEPAMEVLDWASVICP